jgi:hypothetical protein
MARTATVLGDEWAALSAGDRARRTLEVWQEEHSEFAGLECLGEPLERRRQPKAAAQLLAVLARLAPVDVIAARALLQALLPGLTRLAATTGYDDPAAFEEVVSLAWERILTYPATRCGSVAANVLWDVRKRYRRHREIEAPRNEAVDGAAAMVSQPSAEDRLGPTGVE